MPRIEWASPQQREFALAGPHPVLMLGGYGSAKTYGACVKLHRLMSKYPNSRWAVIRRVFKQLKQTSMVTFDQMTPVEALAARNDQDGTRTFRNGSEVIFLGLDTPGSLGVLQGLEINGAFVDQAEEISEKTWDTIDARVGRWTKLPTMPKRYLWATANPTDELHWLYERFADESPMRAEWAAKGYRCIVADSRTNKFLPQANLEALLAKDEEFQRRFVRGEWGNPEGRIFTVDPLSILEPTPELLEKIRHGMHLHRSLDHGDSAPTCCLWHATDGDGNVYCVTPETRILTADLQHMPAGLLKVGDELCGFDEEVPDTKKRRWKRSTVEAVERIIQPCVKIVLDDHTCVTTSENHLWLAMEPSGNRQGWRTAKSLRPGFRLHRSVDVWPYPDETRDGGYLAAAFDGEGSFGINNKGTVRLNFTQKANGMLGEVARILSERKVHFGIYHRKDGGASSLSVTSKTDILRILGECRPVRLLPKFDVEKLKGFAAKSHPRVVSVEFIGNREVVAIKTTSRTYVAEGLASHNCYREYYVPERLVSDHRRAISVLSGKETYRSQLADPSIFHKSSQKYGGKWSIADEYSDTRVLPHSTALFWSPADNAEMPSRSRIKEYLRVDPEHLHPVTREKGSPRLFFLRKTEEYTNGCERAILELKSQKRVKVEEAGGRDVYSDDRDDTVPDHAYDALKYFVISRPSVMREPAKSPGLLTWQGYSNMMRRRNERHKGMKVKEGWY